MKGTEILEFKVKLDWDKESGASVHINNFPNLMLDMPISFGGRGRFPCPDEVFLSAVGGCILTTFLYFKEKIRLSINDLRILVEGQIEHIGPLGYKIAGITATIKINADEKEMSKAQECVGLSKEYCHLLRSLEKGIPFNVKSEISS